MNMRKKVRAVPPKDDYFMAHAVLAASQSRDPQTQQGAVVVDSKYRPLSFWSNWLPASVHETQDLLDYRATKVLVAHATINVLDAFVGTASQIQDGILYVTGMPCLACVQRAIGRGIRRIVYGHFPPEEDDGEQSRQACKTVHVTLDRYAGNMNWLRDKMNYFESHMPEMFQSAPVNPL
jgi:dCMP deaminase